MLTLGLVCAKISAGAGYAIRLRGRDRKSTRLNSSHSQISYAVFCLKKKKKLLERYSTLLNSSHNEIIYAEFFLKKTGELPSLQLVPQNHEHILNELMSTAHIVLSVTR